MNNIPNKIFLNLGEDLEDFDDFNELGEVTWCVDKVGDGDIEYQRKPIWHDLKENPDDLPKENKVVVVKYISYIGCHECYGIATYRFNQDEQCYEWAFSHIGSYEEILAWMDIPKFK